MSFAVALALATSVPSFDCGKASSNVERMICDDELLKQSDLAVSKAYRAAARRRVARSTAEQAAWLSRRNRCRDAACLLRSFDERLSILLPLAKIGKPLRGGEYGGALWVLPLGGNWYAFSVAAVYDPPGGVTFDAAAAGTFRLVAGKAERRPFDDRDGWSIHRLESGVWRIRCLPTETSCGGINVTLDGDYR